MSLPVGLQQAVETILDTPIHGAMGVSGGDINQAACLETAQGRLFIKWNPCVPQGMFEAEARGLGTLRAAGTPLKIPQVIAQSDEFLILEWLPTARATPLTVQRLGEGLAALHQTTATQHGFTGDNFIGRLPQSNTYEKRWPAFYREQRIRAQIDIARRAGTLPAERERRLNALCDRMETLLPNVAPALLHGDLWGGNWLATEAETPALIDPAAYWGHREVDLAMTELFGGFPPSFYAAYQAAFPLEAGYHERRPLYQLYFLLVHLNLFGESYGSQVDAILRRYL